ncbi:hypothetical protein B5F17_13580 [Butyricicoccus pullicaecorum]|uniref:Uncharacterized protein n=1 Tax=Butyricicoccus pullicaecorum TaxID=501571 RepID=A0A1Y4L2R4_9FIRM|nr:hypothetical protein [Butyricicoccus pullicaecorum]OUP51083.1 hypothetical protein B5F17_13580 [Butyricicoccus pullicaecorum]
MSTTIETLLALTLPEPKTETVTIPRLVMPDGKPLTLELRQLTFNQVADLRARNRDFAVHTVLAGVKAPNLRDRSLREHFDAETPAELVKKLFSAGEIEELSMRISTLSGYHRKTVELVEDVQKN